MDIAAPLKAYNAQESKILKDFLCFSSTIFLGFAFYEE
jgi:hypothetical protein